MAKRGRSSADEEEWVPSESSNGAIVFDARERKKQTPMPEARDHDDEYLPAPFFEFCRQLSSSESLMSALCSVFSAELEEFLQVLHSELVSKGSLGRAQLDGQATKSKPWACLLGVFNSWTILSMVAPVCINVIASSSTEITGEDLGDALVHVNEVLYRWDNATLVAFKNAVTQADSNREVSSALKVDGMVPYDALLLLVELIKIDQTDFLTFQHVVLSSSHARLRDAALVIHKLGCGGPLTTTHDLMRASVFQQGEKLMVQLAAPQPLLVPAAAVAAATAAASPVKKKNISAKPTSHAAGKHTLTLTVHCGLKTVYHKLLRPWNVVTVDGPAEKGLVVTCFLYSETDLDGDDLTFLDGVKTVEVKNGVAEFRKLKITATSQANDGHDFCLKFVLCKLDKKKETPIPIEPYTYVFSNPITVFSHSSYLKKGSKRSKK